MKNNFDDKILENKKNGLKLFCVFLTYAYPNVKATERLILQAEKDGVDIIELGFPFSDPLADGPTIQHASEQVLKKHVKIKDAFKLVSRVREKGARVPIVYFGYFNPILSYGIKDFACDARRAGIDGLILPDLPPEEERDFFTSCEKVDLKFIQLVAPTTTLARAKYLAAKTQGFLYYVSLRGVTGARASLPKDLSANIKKVKKLSKVPVLAGFGVSTPEQARSICKTADGVIVGSAVISRLGKSVAETERYIKQMSRAVHA